MSQKSSVMQLPQFVPKALTSDTICELCRESIEVLPEIVRQFSLERYAGGGTVSLYKGRGCDHCGGTGYHGRTSILEVLEMTDPICSLVLRRAKSQLIRQAAVEDGMRTMHQDGLVKALSGVTTLDEVLRVTHETRSCRFTNIVQ